MGHGTKRLKATVLEALAFTLYQICGLHVEKLWLVTFVPCTSSNSLAVILWLVRSFENHAVQFVASTLLTLDLDSSTARSSFHIYALVLDLLQNIPRLVDRLLVSGKVIAWFGLLSHILCADSIKLLNQGSQTQIAPWAKWGLIR